MEIGSTAPDFDLEIASDHRQIITGDRIGFLLSAGILGYDAGGGLPLFAVLAYRNHIFIKILSGDCDGSYLNLVDKIERSEIENDFRVIGVLSIERLIRGVNFAIG
ncbi:hypothetical protein SDC9_118481 [bioreactor metagenome]|uniref:Uncharacterized protein n=1 Tax=bioreactor metagenome TaxID=1076179 RepID=A0A645C127_9ZZZZ